MICSHFEGRLNVWAQFAIFQFTIYFSLYVSRLMNKIRDQYHFRKTNSGIDAWSVQRLILLSKDLPIRKIDPRKISELDENHWYFHDPDLLPTPRSIVEHFKLVRECELKYPVILDQEGRVMDGMHRICEALIGEVLEIAAVQFTIDPDSDYKNCSLDDLAHDV